MSVDVYDDFRALPAHLREALSFPAEPRFERSLQWFENLHAQVFGAQADPRIYVSESQGEAPVALFCAVSRERPRELTSLTNFYSLEFGPSGAVARSRVAAGMARIAEHIATEAFDRLELRLLLDGSPEASETRLALEQAGFRCSDYFQFDNWIRRDDSAGGRDFEAYYASLPSKLKNTVRRKGNRLQRDHTVRIERVKAPGAALEQAIEDYVAVYNKSWKEPEPYPEFMPSMIRLAASLDALTLGTLYLDDAPVATQVWLHEPGRTVIYKLAYDEAYKQTSAGSVLSRALFEDAFARGDVGVIDYGVGNEAYKRDWMTENQRLVGLVGYNSARWGGRWGIAKDAARRIAKRLLKGASDQ